jgi:hypothetical protein
VACSVEYSRHLEGLWGELAGQSGMHDGSTTH